RLIAAGTNPAPQVFATTGNLTLTLIPPTDGAEFQTQVRWARAASQCAPIRDLEGAADAPLTVGRFFSNLIHSFARTRLRIPPDPQQAYEKFCHQTTQPASIGTS